jgi:hypothetical protein
LLDVSDEVLDAFNCCLDAQRQDFFGIATGSGSTRYNAGIVDGVCAWLGHSASRSSKGSEKNGK